MGGLTRTEGGYKGVAVGAKLVDADGTECEFIVVAPTTDEAARILQMVHPDLTPPGARGYKVTVLKEVT